MISDYEKNDIATAYLARGRAEGLEEGRAEGREEGLAEGLAEGEKVGIEKGREEGIELVAKNILSLGIISIEDIAKSTGLSPERIKSL